MLSNPKLREHYDDVTWLFVTRNFNDDATDREAARTHDRFGVTSWPQLVLFDPHDDRVLADMPRGLEPFLQRLKPLLDAVSAPSGSAKTALTELERARALSKSHQKQAVEIAKRLAARSDELGVWLAARELLRELEGDSRSLAERLEDPDERERVLAIEALPDSGKREAADWIGPVSKLLFNDAESVTVRLRAANWLAKIRPAVLAERAAALLEVPSDALRYTVLDALADAPDPALGPQLARIFAGAGGQVPSRNPNVLRMHVAECLGSCGDASAIDAVASLVREANPLNGTTGKTLAALALLAPRLQASDRRRIAELLLEGLPAALEPGAEDALTRTTHALLGDWQRAFAAAIDAHVAAPPTAWSTRDRDGYRNSAKRRLRR